MANPVSAYRDIPCEGCKAEIPQGESIDFEEGDKLCEQCAAENGNICGCGQYKKAEFKECYECNRA